MLTRDILTQIVQPLYFLGDQVGTKMLSVKGMFENGTARPVEPIKGRDGQAVIITFIEEEPIDSAKAIEEGWDELIQLIKDSEVDTGITDLAQEHDHYLYGKPKKINGNL
jgi:hypothetical protein